MSIIFESEVTSKREYWCFEIVETEEGIMTNIIYKDNYSGRYDSAEYPLSVEELRKLRNSIDEYLGEGE